MHSKKRKKQKNRTSIAVLHSKVTERPSTWSQSYHLTACLRRLELISQIPAELYDRSRPHFKCALMNTVNNNHCCGATKIVKFSVKLEKCI